MSNRILVLNDDRTGPGAVPVGDGNLGPGSLDAVLGNWLWQKITADATPIALDVVQAPALDANTVYSFEGWVIARYAGASTGGAYRVQGAVKKGAANANTALVGTPLVVAYEDTAGMDLGVTADTTNGRLILTATGVSATSINWKASLRWMKIGAAL